MSAGRSEKERDASSSLSISSSPFVLTNGRNVDSHLLAQHAGDAEHGPAAVDELGLAVPVFFGETGKFSSGFSSGASEGKKIKGEPFFPGFRTLAAADLNSRSLRSVSSAPPLRVLAAPFAHRGRTDATPSGRVERRTEAVGKQRRPFCSTKASREIKDSLPSQRLGVRAEADGVEAAVSREGAVEVGRGRDS